MPISRSYRQLKTQGFTLIELIIGIVVLAISFSLLTTLILPLSEKSAEQLHQVRAAELGQSMINEILARAFDENSDMAGGLIRCGEPADGSNNCTITLGAESGEGNRELYNDVDDYINFNFNTETNALGENLTDLYPGFNVTVSVCYSNFSPNCSGSIEVAKLIIIYVTTPQEFTFVFSSFKANF